MSLSRLEIPSEVTTPTWEYSVRCRDTKAGWYDGGDPGVAAEHAFERIASSRGWGDVVRASAEDNMMKHIDVYLHKAPATEPSELLSLAVDDVLSVDIKSKKHRSQMQRAEDCEDCVWVELHGERINSVGWLWRGEGAAALAFERGDHFLIVSREALRNCVREHVDFDAKVQSPLEAELRVYQRGLSMGAGKYDESTLMPIALLEEIAAAKWPIA